MIKNDYDDDGDGDGGEIQLQSRTSSSRNTTITTTNSKSNNDHNNKMKKKKKKKNSRWLCSTGIAGFGLLLMILIVITIIAVLYYTGPRQENNNINSSSDNHDVDEIDDNAAAASIDKTTTTTSSTTDQYHDDDDDDDENNNSNTNNNHQEQREDDDDENHKGTTTITTKDEDEEEEEKDSSKLYGKRPNIVLFIGDDQSIFDYTMYGRNNNTAVPTFVTESFAKESLIFDKVFTGQTICSPSRSILYTGLYPVRNGCYLNHRSIRSNVKTLPRYLKELGYTMILAGKSHVKPANIFPWDERYNSIHVIDKPRKGIPFNDIQNFIWKYNNNTNDNNNPFCIIVASEYPHPPYYETTPYELDDVLLPPYIPDTEMNRNEYARYYANIIEKENEFAKLLEIIDNNGSSNSPSTNSSSSSTTTSASSNKNYSLKDNTVVIYTDDHGAQGGKFWTYDRGMNVAMIIRWPNVIKPGERTRELTSFTDFVPTFIELAGGIVPDNLDGKSMLPTWEKHSWIEPKNTTSDNNTTTALVNSTAISPSTTTTTKTTTTTGHDYVYGIAHRQGIRYGRGVYPQRSIHDGRYHYIYNFNSQQRIDRENITNYFYIRGATTIGDYYDEELLFDTEMDPYELNNIIGHEQNNNNNETNMIYYENIKIRLKNELFRWLNEDQNDFLKHNESCPFLFVDNQFRLDIEDPDVGYMLPQDQIGILEDKMEQF